MRQPPQRPPEPIDKDAVIEQATFELARQPRKLRDQIQGPEFLKAVGQVLPKILTPERFVRVTLTTLMRVPKLAECTPQSMFRALLDCSAAGLEPNGRQAHLIPYRNNKKNVYECQLIFDYKGLVELVRRSGDVSYVHADVVYERDDWSFGYGTDAHLRHKPNLQDRGSQHIGFYSFVRLKDRSEDFMVLSPDEVEKVRKRSKSPEEGPWVTDYDEMGKKTAFRRHSKWLPLSPDVREAVARDQDAIDISGWDELIVPEGAPEGEAPKRTTARDTIMQQRSFAQDTSDELQAGNEQHDEDQSRKTPQV